MVLNKHNSLIVILLMTTSLLVSASAEPTFLIDSSEEWQMVLEAEDGRNSVIPTEMVALQLQSQLWQGPPNPEIIRRGIMPDFGTLAEATLEVFQGDASDPEVPDEPSLIMSWGDSSSNPLDHTTSGWTFEYGVDPDLSNSTISLVVHPPAAITNVSFGLEDINGLQVSWSWVTGVDIPSSPPWTTITINTNDIPTLGMTAPSPSASGYVINAGFDITKVLKFFVNETFHTTAGSWTPTPGTSQKLYWNAWDEFMVIPNTGGGGTGPAPNSKWYVKWSQPPEITSDNMIYGWDERSLFRNPPVMADDWQCDDQRPITDVHWWGSFLGWTQPHPPQGQMPKGFHLGIWTDVPNPNPDDPTSYSHPGELIWENYCESSVWNFAGFDLDPRTPSQGGIENEACFQFAQFLSQDEWFWQNPIGADGTPGGSNVYWLSIAAYYSQAQIDQGLITNPWGWKTRPHNFNDDAVRTTEVINGDGTLWPGTTPNGFVPYTIGARWSKGNPVELNGESWDLAFELTTNEPGYEDNPIPGDLNIDGAVNLIDLSIFAAHWLEVAP